MSNLTYFDAHVHANLMDSPLNVARSSNEAGLGLFTCGVTPHDYLELAPQLSQNNIRVGLGAHPWYISDGRVTQKDIELLLELMEQTPYLGEIGLDFSSRYCVDGLQELQVKAFTKICKCAAELSRNGQPRVLSMHTVRSVDAVLDILEQTGAAQACIPIIHWFSGSSDELQEAIKLGCWFSVGELSLKTKRGREYAKVYPKDKLLTETDLPSSDQTNIGSADIVDSLKRALSGLSEARGYSVQTEVMTNAAGVFGV
ncbi:MAG: TatD family hydrolase [Atopobium sp.]|nr:TatD family hydrolase [Atopobium sp.]